MDFTFQIIWELSGEENAILDQEEVSLLLPL